MSETQNNSINPNVWLSPLAVGAYFAVFKLLLHFTFNSNYGFFRDELYFIACGEHLAFGYPDHAPLVAFAAKTSRVLFGDSLFALRLFPALAGAFKVFLTAVLVREFGGKSFAAFLACLCVLCAPIYLAIDDLFSMNPFEPVFWMLCVYFAVKAIKGSNESESETQHSALSTQHSLNWIPFGIFAGLGLMNKHSMIFFGVSLVAGLLLTKDRKVFLDKYFWLGGVIAFLIFLPNIIWQFQNDFATLELLQNVQKTGKNIVMSPFQFFISQILGMFPTAFPVWLAGIWFFLADKNGKRFRFLGVAYLVLLALMIFLKAKDYYLAPVYPMLFAAGAVWIESKRQKAESKIETENSNTGFVNFKQKLLPFAFLLLPFIIALPAMIVAPTVMPILPIETLVRYQQRIGIKPPKSEVGHDSELQQIFSEQLGWQEMVEKVADVYNNLPPEDRAKAGIYAGNYGEAGAIDFYGGAYGLPKAISPHQSYFLWGPREYTGEVLILLGASKEKAEKNCNSVEEKTEVNFAYSESYEQYKIIVCRNTKKPLPEIWQSLKFWN